VRSICDEHLSNLPQHLQDQRGQLLQSIRSRVLANAPSNGTGFPQTLLYTLINTLSTTYAEKMTIILRFRKELKKDARKFKELLEEMEKEFEL